MGQKCEPLGQKEKNANDLYSTLKTIFILYINVALESILCSSFEKLKDNPHIGTIQT